MRRPLSTFVPLVAFMAVAAGCGKTPDKPQQTAGQADSQRIAAENQQLKDQLKEATAETQRLKDQFEEATAESRRLQSDLTAAVARADKAEAHVKKLETQLASATSSVTPAEGPVKVSPAKTAAKTSVPNLPEVKPGDYKMLVTDKGITITLPGDVKLEMVKIPAGDFIMGCDEHDPREKPAHHVVITRDFLLGKYEVTQAQYEAVMGKNPSLDAGRVNRLNVGPDNPVDSLTCNDADAFAARVDQGVSSPTVHFVLPTEAQWEYACRAGTTTLCFHGDRFDNAGEFGWYSDNSQGKSHPVGQKKPNALGLYDMYGNVFEWCSDLYDPFYYNKTPEKDPQGPLPDEVTGTDRSMRGGSWQYGVMAGHSTFRGNSFGDGGHHIGFRLAAVPR